MNSDRDDSIVDECEHCRPTPKWRRDFPIEWEGDHYVTRREMVKFLTLGSLILAVANWVVAFSSRLVHRGSRAERYIAPASALQQPGSLLFRYPTDSSPCIAVRTPEGELVAYSQVCTHLSCAVVYDSEHNQLFCPCHRGVFAIRNGDPIAGPPVRPLAKIKLEQRGDAIYAVAEGVS